MNAEPNGAHRALFDLQQRGIVKSIVTQNVDGLHQKAGSTDVIDLHGRIDGVSCISCGNKLSRVLYQQELEKLNEEYKQVSSTVSVEAGTEARPDGDVDIGDMDSSKVCFFRTSITRNYLLSISLLRGHNYSSQFHRAPCVAECINQTLSSLAIRCHETIKRKQCTR